jgi:hypothetical protein
MGTYIIEPLRQGMVKAGREPLRADPKTEVDVIAQTYVAEAGGDPVDALRRAIADALADLLEMERRSRRAERLISRGYVRGALREPR